MPDYLSCGACHAEFEVVDFYRFLDHKLTDCHVRFNGDQALAGAESILECSKCLKKCRTPWALLQHLQADHYMSVARTLLLPSSGAPAPYLTGSRQRSVDQTSMSEACTQTTRSCLKRQVCPYEEGLPDDCCLKASKEQRESDRGCCCMDSLGAKGCSGGCGGGGGGSGGGGGGSNSVSGGDRQTDCCLAVPKKRRLLPAASSAAPASASLTASNASSNAGAAALPPAASPVDACCGLRPDCALLQPGGGARPVQSVECQTDFVDNLLDLDVNMLLDDCGVGDVDDGGGGPAAAAASTPPSSLSSSTSPQAAAKTRRPLPPAPSKAIQTISRVADLGHVTIVAADAAPPPPSSVAFFYSAVPETMQFEQQQPQYQTAPHQYAEEPTQQPMQQPQYVQLPPDSLGSLPLPLPPLDARMMTVRIGQQQQLSAISVPSPRPREMKYKCGQCTRTFRQNIHLRKHVMSQHSHSKPHKCPSCEYTTVEKSHLTVHIRKHTGERPYSCRDCNYSTAQNCTLKAHYLRKHPGSIVHCGRCGHDFVTEHERDKHERSCSSGGEIPVGPAGV